MKTKRKPGPHSPGRDRPGPDCPCPDCPGPDCPGPSPGQKPGQNPCQKPNFSSRCCPGTSQLNSRISTLFFFEKNLFIEK